MQIGVTMVKISKKGYLLTILLVISLKSFALDLQAELDKIELEERIAWKTIMLARLLNEEEQIEALENGIREKMNRNGDFSLNSKIREAEKIYRNKK